MRADGRECKRRIRLSMPAGAGALTLAGRAKGWGDGWEIIAQFRNLASRAFGPKDRRYTDWGLSIAWACGSYRDPPDPGASITWPAAQHLIVRPDFIGRSHNVSMKFLTLLGVSRIECGPPLRQLPRPTYGYTGFSHPIAKCPLARIWVKV